MNGIAPTTFPLNDLLPELLSSVLTKGTYAEVAQWSLVNKKWYEVCTEIAHWKNRETIECLFHQVLSKLPFSESEAFSEQLRAFGREECLNTQERKSFISTLSPFHWSCKTKLVERVGSTLFNLCALFRKEAEGTVVEVDDTEVDNAQRQLGCFPFSGIPAKETRVEDITTFIGLLHDEKKTVAGRFFKLTSFATCALGFANQFSNYERAINAAFRLSDIAWRSDTLIEIMTPLCNGHRAEAQAALEAILKDCSLNNKALDAELIAFCTNARDALKTLNKT